MLMPVWGMIPAICIYFIIINVLFCVERRGRAYDDHAWKFCDLTDGAARGEAELTQTMPSTRNEGSNANVSKYIFSILHKTNI